MLVLAATSGSPAQDTPSSTAAPRPPATQPSAAPAPLAPPARIAWLDLDDKQRDAVQRVLADANWPIRVFGLLRLERYGGEGVWQLVQSKWRDSAWQARCFAIRQALRMNVPINAAAFADETDARVIRTVLRAGVALPDKKVRDLASKLMQSRNIEDQILGLEIAAASSIQPLRKDAATRTARFINEMNNAVAALISRRLRAIVHAAGPPSTASQWRQWLARQNGAVQLARPQIGRELVNSATSQPPLVAQLDDDTFTRLLDYLSILKQRDLELAIVMDATASMRPMVDQARAGIDSLIVFLSDISREMRLAFIAYRDHDNKPVWDGHAFTTNVNSIRDYLFKLRITGGADYPEAVFEGLAACAELKWSKQATKQIVLVGDAPPHEGDLYRIRALLDSYVELGMTVHAAHVPMEYPAGHVERMSPDQASEARRWLKEYNKGTAEAFAEIALAGGGRKTEMDQPEKLVPAIMHFAIDESWWDAFDEFYAVYVALCR
jgi:hypothetical protein